VTAHDLNSQQNGFVPDRQLLEALRRQVNDRLQAMPGESRGDEQERARALITSTITDWQRTQVRTGKTPLGGPERERLAQTLFNEMYGLGPIQDLIDDPRVENINIDGNDPIEVTYSDGTAERIPSFVESDEELEEWVRQLAAKYKYGERSFSPTSPSLDMPLADDGSVRLHAIGFSVTDRTHVAIRVHGKAGYTLDQLVDLRMLDQALADFLEASVRARLSMVIAGEAGAGKTTLLRALCSSIPDARIATIEDTFELGLSRMRPGVVATQTVPGSQERVGADGKPLGARDMRQLTTDALRQNVRRIIVGEARGPEVMDMLRAMTTGAGSMSSVHAKSIEEVVPRMAAMASEAGVRHDYAVEMIAQHIDLIIHIGYVDQSATTGSQSRFVSAVWEIAGAEADGPRFTRMYEPGPDGRARFRMPLSSPVHRAKLEAAGYNLGGHTPPIGPPSSNADGSRRWPG
jgi:pilus assembly protein CpaF